MTPVTGSIAVAGSPYYQQSELYYLLEADLPPAGTYPVQVTYSGTIDYRNAGCISLGYVAQQPPEAVKTNTVLNNDKITTSITTLTNNAWVVDAVGCGNSGTYVTTQAGMTERWDVNSGSSTGAASTTPVPVAGPVSVGWDYSGTGNRQVHSVAAFAPANP
jgi:hypothetical protein